MQKSIDDSQPLLGMIKTKRQELADYLGKTEPRHSRLISCSIVSGALAAALTAGPGIGGEGFIGFAKDIMSFGVPVWQVLCLAATVLSIVVVITNGMLKSHDLTSRIARARTCDAKLEGLETMLKLGQIDMERATQLYTECLGDMAHI